MPLKMAKRIVSKGKLSIFLETELLSKPRHSGDEHPSYVPPLVATRIHLLDTVGGHSRGSRGRKSPSGVQGQSHGRRSGAEAPPEAEAETPLSTLK